MMVTAGALVVVATGGAVAYAIATGGALVAGGGVLIAVGPAVGVLKNG